LSGLKVHRAWNIAGARWRLVEEEEYKLISATTEVIEKLRNDFPPLRSDEFSTKNGYCWVVIQIRA
jgi:hypothetical protein